MYVEFSCVLILWHLDCKPIPNNSPSFQHINLRKQQGFGNSFGRWPRQSRDWSPTDALRPSKRLLRRGTFLKAAMCASLSSVAFLHESGYVHRSLSPSSFLLSQINDDDDAAAFSLLGRLAPKTISNNMNGGSSDDEAPIDDGVLRSLNQGGGLRVKLTDFGFAATLMEAASDPVLRKRCGPKASPFDRTARATAEDLEALGFVWLELVFSSLALSREAPPGRNAFLMRIFSLNSFPYSCTRSFITLSTTSTWYCDLILVRSHISLQTYLKRARFVCVRDQPEIQSLRFLVVHFEKLTDSHRI